MEGSNNGSYLKGPDGSPLTDEQIDQLAEEPYENLGDLETWARHLEQYGVYYSEPLDLDWMMLTAFTDAYRESANSPRSTNPTAISSAQKNVFGSSHSERYSAAQDAGFYTDVETNNGENFVWYNYLFKNKSKPTTHLRALAELDDDEIEKDVPDTLKRLIDHVQSTLTR